MKKYNLKQYMWSRNKVLTDSLMKLQKLFMLVVFVVGMVCIGNIISGNMTWEQLFGIGATGTTCMAIVIGFGNVVGDPDNSKKVGKQVKSIFKFIEASQFDDTQQFPARIGRAYGNIPLKAGEYWHKIESVLDSGEIKWDGTMGDVTAEIKNALMFVLGGMNDDVMEIMEKGIGKGFYIVVEICSTGEQFIAGNGCKPLKLVKFEGGSGKDQTASTLTFENTCGEIWSKYSGNTPTLAAAVIAANAATIGLTSNPQYQLTTGTVAAIPITNFSAVTDADVNRIVTVLGSGGTYPSTIAATAAAFLLIAGETWTAATGKQISFKIFKDGAASYKFVEVPGSRN